MVDIVGKYTVLLLHVLFLCKVYKRICLMYKCVIRLVINVNKFEVRLLPSAR